ncbi:MAG: hypothetical protein ABL919_03175 [Methylococcales bacterium]
MTDKIPSKYLINLEKQFASDNPVLLKAAKIFHELDQIEYDFGLIDADETTASKGSWWPVISLIAGNSPAKSRFLSNYLGTEQLLSSIQASNQKFTVLSHSPQGNTATLPGTALDVDHRYPFYQISRKIEHLQKGEGNRVNAYLELKTISSNRVKNKLFVDAPNLTTAPTSPISSMLSQHIIAQSDLVLVFTDIFDSPTPALNDLIGHIVAHQDSNKFIYLVDDATASLTSARNNEILATWQRKLAEYGLYTGQIILLPNQPANIGSLNQADFAAIDQRIANVENDRSYRVLDAIEKNIEDVEAVIIPELKKAIGLWKERSAFTSFIILGFLATLAIFAEIETGIIISSIIDPIIGPAALVVLIAIMVPIHLLISRLQAKLIISQLNARQKKLHLLENLANAFEANITFWRTLLPISEPAGWNKKTKAKLAHLSDKTKDLVQALNDNFSTYDEHQPHQNNRSDSF